VRLQILNHFIADIRSSDSSRLENGVLFIERGSIESLVSPEIRLADLFIAKPGESVRFAPVLDIVEPRAKENPAETAFPGFSAKGGSACGRGRTHVLKGVAVAAVAGIPGAQEALIDMQAGAAPFCPFARTLNLVLHFTCPGAIDPARADTAIRESLLKVAEFLAGLALDRPPEPAETLEWPLPAADRPKAALVYFVQSQGQLRRTYVCGQPMDERRPALISPLEVLDGAIVSGNFVLPCNKTCTYIHQNNPLIRAMFARHGRSLDFSGVILCNAMSRLEDKQQVVADVSDLCRTLGAAAVVINQEGGANTLTDVMLLCAKLERDGIKTVLLLNEFAGSQGTTPSLAETTPEAGYIVSAGNNDYRLALPAAARFVGNATFPGMAGPLTAAIELPLTRLHSSTNQLGFNRLSCRTDAPPLIARQSAPGRPLRVVHYLNQFFGQIGGEDQAHVGLQEKAGAVGPGLALREQLGSRAEIVATVICGDNAMAENLDANAAEAAERIAAYRPDLLVAGPCFNAGRYGMACGAVCQATAERLGIWTVMGIAETNPAVEVYRRQTLMVPVGGSAAKMRAAMQAMVAVALAAAEGRPLEAGSVLPRGLRELTAMEKTGAARAVDMLAARLCNEPANTELPLPKFDRVAPAPPIADLSRATIVLATEGGLTPTDNPDRIEMSMATKFGCYSLAGMAAMDAALFAVAHGGYDNRIARQDPNRLLPLDVLREFENERTIGKVADVFYSTSGNATAVENAARFGKAIAADIRRRFTETVGVVFTAT
jgi:glycine reductase